MQDPVQTPQHGLPSVDSLSRSLNQSVPHLIRVEVARAAIDQARADGSVAEENAVAALKTWELRRPTRVINGTGVLLHTNLGRAPLHPAAAEAAATVSTGYSNTELKLADGTRGDRAGYVHDVLSRLTGAQAALVVNNNAGALYLTLAALTQGREVPVSRGELIEIGGSYRLPELMAATGTVLVEVGTTNKTHLKDYDGAIDSDTAAVLKVHPSNYRTEGFVADVGYGELAELAERRSVHFLADVGSGLLDETAPWLPKGAPAWLKDEPGVKQALSVGADLVLFSGDKLLGGPQAGIIVGNRKLIGRLRAHPAARALRCSAGALAALTTTLDFYADGKAAELPLWAMATATDEDLTTRLEKVSSAAGLSPKGEIVIDASVAGGGTLPGLEIKGPVLRIPGPGTDRRWQRLLEFNPPIIARRSEGDLVVDLRTVDLSDDEAVAAALADPSQ